MLGLNANPIAQIITNQGDGLKMASFVTVMDGKSVVVYAKRPGTNFELQGNHTSYADDEYEHVEYLTDNDIIYLTPHSFFQKLLARRRKTKTPFSQDPEPLIQPPVVLQQLPYRHLFYKKAFEGSAPRKL